MYRGVRRAPDDWRRVALLRRPATSTEPDSDGTNEDQEACATDCDVEHVSQYDWDKSTFYSSHAKRLKTYII